ncbi:hypothetical protein GW17_00020965 [Ensete ventricosum]|nr:hypothetical protein GW17_00020965 [Ensete ventricosum]RZR80222.1 hypothetical protein BHM03_00006172 [Ensete ventricosum]
MAAARVEEQRDAKNTALIPDDRTLRDSNIGRLVAIGDRPSFELYRGLALQYSTTRFNEKMIYYLMKRGGYMFI